MATAFRRWLQRHPIPVELVAYDSEDDECARISVGVHRKRWSDAESGIEGCARVVALDSKGSVLRTHVFEEPVAPKETAVRKAGTEIVDLARLISAAHDAGAARHEAAYRMAFEFQAALVKTLSGRLTGLEEAWHRTIMNADKQPGADETADDVIKQMITTYAMSKMMPAGPQASEPESDGD